MSTVSVARGPGGSRGQGLRPALRLLAPPLPRRWRPSFVAVCSMIMLGCLASLLGINILLTRGAYTEQQLTLKQTALMESEQALSEKVSAQASPELLGQRARALGMIPNSSPAFIELKNGTIAGSPTPASTSTAPEAADLGGTPLTPQQQAAAAAEANGGVTADGNAASVPLVDPGQGAPAPTTGSTAGEGTSDGAVLVDPGTESKRTQSAAVQAETGVDQAENGSNQAGSTQAGGESHATTQNTETQNIETQNAEPQNQTGEAEQPAGGQQQSSTQSQSAQSQSAQSQSAQSQQSSGTGDGAVLDASAGGGR